MNIYDDNRIVMTLDAGGTNFVFAAVKGGECLGEPFSQPAHADDLDACLTGLISGFTRLQESLSHQPVAIAFAFPGPADYKNGVIGDLPNLPAFRGGVALAKYLEEHFNLPVFIRNDGDLYAYGEALGGILPKVNQKLASAGKTKVYENLVGITLGTGFGAGIVQKQVLVSGDNGIAGEVWNTPNAISPGQNAEEGVSTRAIKNSFESNKNVTDHNLEPKDIYEIAMDDSHVHHLEAKQAFADFGTHLGDALANILSLFDSSIVIGGGLVGAKHLFMPSAIAVLEGEFENGQNRNIHNLCFIDDEEQMEKLLANSSKFADVPSSDTKVEYWDSPTLFIATSELGCSKAVALGAYALALSQLDIKGS